MAAITLTVFFEDPFWVGVVERQEDDTLHAARHIFGSEPSPPQVLEFVLYQLSSLLAKPAVAVSAEQPAPRPANPKRAAREAARALAQRGSSAQAYEALRLQLEQNKQLRKQHTRAQREAEANYKRRLKLQKAKARHRGR